MHETRLNTDPGAFAHELGHLLGLHHTENPGRLRSVILRPFEDDTVEMRGNYDYVMPERSPAEFPVTPAGCHFTDSEVDRMRLTLLSCYDRTWIALMLDENGDDWRALPDAPSNFTAPRYCSAFHASWMG